MDSKAVSFTSSGFELATACNFTKEPFQQVGLDTSGATYAEIASSNGKLYQAVTRYFLEKSASTEQMFNNPTDEDSDVGEDEEINDSEILEEFKTSIHDFEENPGLRSLKAPEKPRFGLGLGLASVVHRDRKVYALHFSIPNHPVRVFDKIDVYRGLVVATEGQGPETQSFLRDFCWFMMKWVVLQNEQRRSPGSYMLYRLKTDRDCQYVLWTNRGEQSVFLPERMKNALTSDIEHFLAPKTRKWYRTHGLPYRRSYLFYGPPGTGKTSLIRSCAGKYRFNLAFFALTNKNFSNQALNEAFRNVPNNCAIVIEDFDRLFVDRENVEAGEVTFSSFLNALDGFCSTDQCIVFLTTNDLEKMYRQDPALLRAGRVDRRFKFEPPTPGIIQNMFLSFYPDADRDLATNFANLIFDRKEDEAISIATLQELFIYCEGKSATACVGCIDEFFDMFCRDRTTRNSIYL